MRLKFRSWLAGVALLAGALGPVAAPGVACAASSAALVVSTGGSDYAYCVDLGGSSVNGIQLIQRASQQHGLQYKLGYGGKAVCMLANVGASGNDCFGKHPYFWGLWQGDGSGGWSWSGTGAANLAVDAGDIQGWSWGTGDSGSNHPPPPAATYESVCGVAPSPPPSTKPGGSKGGGGDNGGWGGPPGSSGGSDGPSTEGSGGGPGTNHQEGSASGTDYPRGGDDKNEKQKPKRGGDARGGQDESAAVPSPSASVTPVTASDPAGARAPDSEAPTAAFVALGAAAVLGIAGAVLVRRRQETT